MRFAAANLQSESTLIVSQTLKTNVDFLDMTVSCRVITLKTGDVFGESVFNSPPQRHRNASV